MSADLAAESAESKPDEAKIADKLEALSLSEQGARDANTLEEDESCHHAGFVALLRMFLPVANQ